MMNRKLVFTLVSIAAIISILIPACSPKETITGYTAIIPSILQADTIQNISVQLFNKTEAASGKVEISLIDNGKVISQTQSTINKYGSLSLKIPDIEEGEYTIRIQGNDFQDEGIVNIVNNYFTLLETDKPIYKPGQDMQIRVITLDPELKPVSENVNIEVLDAEGIKIFKTEVTTDEYGMSNVSLPISQEPNLGTWKITASTEKTEIQTDVRVEEYVLPKYEVKVNLPRDWFLVNEPIEGNVTSIYSFGKEVKGTLEITATKYVGQWEEYANLSIPIQGNTDFEIPPAYYVAGVADAGGNGNVKLTFNVIEDSTGYQETTENLVTITDSSLNIQIIPSANIFKPGLPYVVLVITQTPNNQLVDTNFNYNISYIDSDYNEIRSENGKLNTIRGKTLIDINPPLDCVALSIDCYNNTASASKSIEAAYSPSGNFIHVEQMSEGTPDVGNNIKFWVYSSKEAKTFYYEIISRNKVVFSNFTQNHEIVITATPDMTPSAKLLVYQILPNSEIAADYIPFDVNTDYPLEVEINLDDSEVKPGDQINIHLQTDGASRIGLAAFDKSVYILAENRMNLQQVFDELERLYMEPQAELHEVNIYDGIKTYGAEDIFKEAGVLVLSNSDVPVGESFASNKLNERFLFEADGMMLKGGIVPAAAPNASQATSDSAGSQLAEVERVRQFFPETWIWENDITTSIFGRATYQATVPDSITTWMLRAVAISKNNGLGIAENQLTVFQPFFISVDLPYSAIRGEEFPVNIAIYNYLEESQEVQVQIEKDSWFYLNDTAIKSVHIDANGIGSASFVIRPNELGINQIKITAQSTAAADAVVKTLIIEPEGVPREFTSNITLSNGKLDNFTTFVPANTVVGSDRAYFTATGSFLTQTIDGLESLIQMPFGCGEQNMIIFAPDVYITRYLKESGQLTPEIMAKAEKLMITGYQRELTYRHTDGSFSAFGNSDQEGSLWLTAFVLKSFSEARDFIYIDDTILEDASDWILSHQHSDGSFSSVGFVHHQEMLGGLEGEDALSAYVAIALIQSGHLNQVSNTISYLEKRLDGIDDAYTMALVAYALELTESSKKDSAYDKLMGMVKEDENGIYWGDAQPFIELNQKTSSIIPVPQDTSSIETTAYALLSLIEHGDNINASKAAKWLVSNRNAYGGFGSTQDTVMALQSLVAQSTISKSNVDLDITLQYGKETKELSINSSNFDVLQVVDIPTNTDIKITSKGTGEAVGQIVQKFNIPEASNIRDAVLKVDVDYDATNVSVNDIVGVDVALFYSPVEQVEAGMVVVDISIPTGFEAVRESIEEAVELDDNIKRYDISGRKVIFYIENLLPEDSLFFSFNVKAMYPVKARAAVSRAYSYYQPDITAETLGVDITVTGK